MGCFFQNVNTIVLITIFWLFLYVQFVKIEADGAEYAVQGLFCRQSDGFVRIFEQTDATERRCHSLLSERSGYGLVERAGL